MDRFFAAPALCHDSFHSASIVFNASTAPPTAGSSTNSNSRKRFFASSHTALQNFVERARRGSLKSFSHDTGFASISTPLQPYVSSYAMEFEKITPSSAPISTKVPGVFIFEKNIFMSVTSSMFCEPHRTPRSFSFSAARPAGPAPRR